MLNKNKNNYLLTKLASFLFLCGLSLLIETKSIFATGPNSPHVPPHAPHKPPHLLAQTEAQAAQAMPAQNITLKTPCDVRRLIASPDFQNPARNFCYNMTFEKGVTDYLLGTWEEAAAQRTAFLEALKSHPWQAGDHLHLALNLIDLNHGFSSGLRDLSPLHGLPFKEATIVGNENRGATPSLRLQVLGAFQLLQAVHIAGAQNVAHVLCDLPFVHTIDIGAFENDFMEKMGAKNQLSALRFSSCDRLHNHYFPINLDILGRFTNLRVLEINYCWPLEKLAFISNLTELESFSLGGYHQLIDIAGIEACLKLRHIALVCTKIWNPQNTQETKHRELDVTPLANLPLLEKVELVRWHELHNLDALQTAPNLHTVDLSELQTLTSFQDLAGYPRLRVLKANSVPKRSITDRCLPVRDLSTLEELQSLEVFEFANYGCLTNIAHLATRTNLTDLNLSDAGVKDFSALSQLINLTHLNLSYCTYFQDCNILSPCKKLEVLNCSHCSSLKSTEGLEGCPNLVKVNLWVTNIYRTGGLANHPKLRELRLTNESKSLEFLQTCPNIEVLMLHKQGDLQKLPFLPKLRELELSQPFLREGWYTQETPWPNLTQPLQLRKLAFGQAGFYVDGIRHHRASLTEEFGDQPLPADCAEGETFESLLNKDTPDPGSDPDILARILSMCSKEHLEELHLPMCYVASDVSQLATYPNLKVLDLSRSNVKAIPASFAALKSLQTLNLKSCSQLKAVNVPGCASLHTLDLHNCEKLEAVNVPGCVSLVHCNVRFCRKMSEAQKKALAPLL